MSQWRTGCRGLWIACMVACAGCGSDDAQDDDAAVEVTPAPPGQPYEQLSAWNLFSDVAGQVPQNGVVPYSVNSVLWSDAASKHRFIYVPEGASVGYEPEAKWRFPVGTILVKTFGMRADLRDPASDERLLETRLLVHEPDAWVAHVYVYDQSGGDAKRTPVGTTLPVSFVDETGQTVQNDYGVPNTNQCQECHGRGSEMNTLGGRTRQLERDGDYGDGLVNQIDHMAALGWFDAAPEPPAQREALPDPMGSASVSERARSYMDANCGHCHGHDGGASTSGLKLAWEHTGPGADPAEYGVCKVPTSAGGGTCGLTWDVVPGNPDQSILICRVETREPKVQMPPLATKLIHEHGVALLREWISAMTEPACQ